MAANSTETGLAQPVESVLGSTGSGPGIGAPTRRAAIAGGLMGLAALSAAAMTPPETNSAELPRLDQTVPQSFGGWTLLPETTPLLPDEDTQATIRQIYDETLARTYVNDAGERVMLVIAYGARQTDSLRAHQPEVCYTAQGFSVTAGQTALLSKAAPIPVTRLFATLGARAEPISYWMAVDSQVTGFSLKLKWQQIKAGFERRVPEGFLVRASLIGPNDDASYATLNRFLVALLQAVPRDIRHRLSGL